MTNRKKDTGEQETHRKPKDRSCIRRDNEGAVDTKDGIADDMDVNGRNKVSTTCQNVECQCNGTQYRCHMHCEKRRGL